MIPRILEYEEGLLRITPEAYTIPEIKHIIDKYGAEAEKYLAYVTVLSYPDSPYRHIPQLEQIDSALYDVKETLGDFDEEDVLIQIAVDRLRGLWESPQSLLADEMEEELHRWRVYLRDTPLSDGVDGNMRDRLAFVDKVEKISAAAANIRKIADAEVGPKMKGSNDLGEY